jgi:hypothetical protein
MKDFTYPGGEPLLAMPVGAFCRVLLRFDGEPIALAELIEIALRQAV